MELHNYNTNFIHLWTAEHNPHLTVQCQVGMLNHLRLPDQDLFCHKQYAEGCTTVANDTDASKATDNTEIHTAAANASDATEAEF